MKKSIIAICIFAASFCALADTETVDGITWNYTVSGNKATIYKGSYNSAIPTSTSGAITIPSTLGGCPVTSIGQYAFYDCNHLTSVTIPDSVTSIGYCAFYDCYHLTSVTIPDSVTSIGGDAFSYCDYLKETRIEVSDMARWATNWATNSLNSKLQGARRLFVNGEEMTNLIIPDSVTRIGLEAFCNCSGLASVAIPDSVTSIGQSAFYGCSGLSSVHISELAAWCGISFDNYDSNPLYYAKHLFLNGVEATNLVIPDSITSIGPYVFSGCSGLASVTIPNSVTSIGQSAFYGCSGLASVAIPDSVTSIGQSAFYGCSGLTLVVIPNSVTSIGQSAFTGCSRLKNVEIPQRVCATNLSVYFPDSWKHISKITIAEGVGFIADSAFEGCSWLESVTIPWTVTRIGDRAFYDCIRLREIIFEGNAPDRIGEDVFGGTQRSLAFKVPEGSIGWDGGISSELPGSWNGRAIAAYQPQGGSNTPEENPNGDPGNNPGNTSGNVTQSGVSLTVTNIVLHYVTQSLSSDAVSPPMESGIINVVTEVGAGSAVAISSDWAAQYPGFTEKFGNDFGAAITAQTGKRDGSGNPMFVWQDFVAGTDPTDSNDVFTASITFDLTTGEPVISWSPELSATEAAKRSYTTYGKVRLTDPDWTPIDGDEADYNFFKVEVKMK